MRFICSSLIALVTLTLATWAQAQNPGPGATMPDQMERGVSLSVPSLAPDVPDLAKSLQTELKRVGCFEGAIDGVWDGKTKAALVDFARRAKLDVPTDGPTPAAVDALKNRRDRICPLDCGAGRIERNGQCVAKPVPEAKAAKPQPTGEARRAPREKPEQERPSSGMCWRDDGRSTALAPCSEVPGGRRAY